MTSIVFKAIQKLPQSIAKLKKALKASQKPKAARSYQPDSYFYGRSRNIDKELAVLKADGLTSEDVIRATKAIEARRTAGQKGYIKRLKKRDKKVIKYNKGQVVSQKALDKKRIKSLKASDKALAKRSKAREKDIIKATGKRQNIISFKTFLKKRKKRRAEEIDPLVDPKGAAKQRHKEIKKRYGVKGRPGKYRVKKHWTEWIERGGSN